MTTSRCSRVALQPAGFQAQDTVAAGSELLIVGDQ
jgi:hypothetical protein